MSILDVSGLQASYGNRIILEKVSFLLEGGYLYGLLGSNGSGKSTLMNAICRCTKASGNIYINNQSISSLSSRALSRLITYIPQKSHLDISMSLLDVVLMGFNSSLSILEAPSKHHRAMAMAALEKVGLKARAYEDYQALSEGQKQLCILARALVEACPLMLLDEPDSSLDFNNRYNIVALVKSIINADTKRTALITLHDPNLALSFCDYLLLLDRGTIIDKIDVKNESAEVIENKLRILYPAACLVKGPDRYVISVKMPAEWRK